MRSADRGYFRITGRIDDVLNVSGHRMGTMEIESALVAKTDLVAEAAVVGRPDDVTGEAICAFVVLKRSRPTGEEAKQIANELRNWVAKRGTWPIAKPKDIRFGDNLPKTRSGKIMRRLLRSIAAKGEAITQDTSTLENPQSWINWPRPTDPFGLVLTKRLPSRRFLWPERFALVWSFIGCIAAPLWDGAQLWLASLPAPQLRYKRPLHALSLALRIRPPV